jgi:hypothetical protein
MRSRIVVVVFLGIGFLLSTIKRMSGEPGEKLLSFV